MPASPCFSECRRWWRVALALLCASCASVRPEDREYLAEPALTWGGDGMIEQHERHVLENREASTGGGDVSGGGCGCN